MLLKTNHRDNQLLEQNQILIHIQLRNNINLQKIQSAWSFNFIQYIL
ncbi:unnamed protein product [Paramecium sonneborni]|nr:unnamed protein product [Paramecium sonneborni]